jgi:Ni,Fe-hydrogenase III large subunit
MKGEKLLHKLTDKFDINFGDIPKRDNDDFREAVVASLKNKSRIGAFFGHLLANNNVDIIAILIPENKNHIEIIRTEICNSYHAITHDIPSAHLFEREIAEQWGIFPEAHPWLKPIRFHKSYRDSHNFFYDPDKTEILPSFTDFFRVEGEEIHEVAVGPVHAGIIEPGHFRFQCYGENVFHLEISLGYQHRGIEKALAGGPDKRSMHLIETAAGDTTIGHTTTYCKIIESLSNINISPKADAVRCIALELERLANHTGDLGALAADVGFLPTASYCGRLRGDLLNLTAYICGNRFGRGIVRPGGVAFDIDELTALNLSNRLLTIFKDLKNAINLMLDTASVMARFEETGKLSKNMAETLGLVGVAARACGIDTDIRKQFPTKIQTKFPFNNPPVCKTGDVYARAYQRWFEIQESMEFISKLLKEQFDGKLIEENWELQPNRLALSLVEGWRGQICHVAITDNNGKFACYKIVDPSFHNWTGLAIALRNQQISDFPLCNKSFNLSYCGHDL